MAQLLPTLKQQFFDDDGAPLVGGKVYTYQAGTSTPLATYTDYSEANENTNPIILDANGEADIWIGAAAYKFVITDPDDVELKTIDNVSYLNNGSITEIKLAPNSVSTSKIQDGAVTEPKIAAGAVTSEKIGDQALLPHLRIPFYSNWFVRDATENALWQGIAFGDGVFVAINLDGTDRVMRSIDGGQTWSAVTVPSKAWNSIAFGGGVFVALASGGTTDYAMYSSDGGETWTETDTAIDASWSAITYGSGTFVAVSLSGATRTMRSTDGGQTWTAVASADDTAHWRSIAYGNGVFVAVASNKDTSMRSVDAGLTWSLVTFSTGMNGWTNIAFGGGVFVAGHGLVGLDLIRVARSTDGGQSWTLVEVEAMGSSPGALAYGNGTFVYGDILGLSTKLSTDGGLTWHDVQSSYLTGMVSAAYGLGRFVAINNNILDSKVQITLCLPEAS